MADFDTSKSASIMPLIFNYKICYTISYKEMVTMIKRELYMKRIRPFIGQNIIKVLTGIRRCGKSVMLTLIQDELKEQGISDDRFFPSTLNIKSSVICKQC